MVRGRCRNPVTSGVLLWLWWAAIRPRRWNCYGSQHHPRCIGAGRSTSVRTAPARSAQPAAVRCVRTLFAHMLKRPGPPAPAPKKLAMLPPGPASAKPDRHRQKYAAWFKVPSTVQTRPAVPLGSHSCLPCPHSCAVCARQSPVRPGVKTPFHACPRPAGALPADGWKKFPHPSRARRAEAVAVRGRCRNRFNI